jgi:exopolyphosphatase / guanosine-5'-triphosphate,3'-diphosphate pyrophosphatase
MSQGKKRVVMSAIDLGSFSLKMKIVEVSPSGEQRVLDQLSKPTSLGKDVFSLGRVKHETVDEVCTILEGFQHLIAEYKSDHCLAVATSAIREAENKDQLIDLIKLRTGLDVETLNNSREKFITYKAIRAEYPEHVQLYREGVMLVEVGAGNVEITLYRDGYLLLTHSIKLGHLRLRRVLAQLEEKSLDFPDLLEEYIESHLDTISNIKEKYNIQHYLSLGSEMKLIKKLSGLKNSPPGQHTMMAEDFYSLYEKVYGKSAAILTRDFNLTLDSAASLLPSMMILKKTLEMTAAEIIHAPLLSLNDGLVAEFVGKLHKTDYHVDFDRDIISQSREMARSYFSDEKHARDVEEKSLALLDLLGKKYGLRKKERLLLQAGAILHDIGKYVSLEQHQDQSFHLINASNLLGLSTAELNIIANIARYHSAQSPYNVGESSNLPPGRDRVVTAKLVAIIRLADAMDSSHKQKISDLKMKIKDRELIIKGTSSQDILLESWKFEYNAYYFRDVFGLSPKLIIERVAG